MGNNMNLQFKNQENVKVIGYILNVIAMQPVEWASYNERKGSGTNTKLVYFHILLIYLSK